MYPLLPRQRAEVTGLKQNNSQKGFDYAMIIGITGPTGAGKSLAAEFFKDKGFYIIDYDKLSREVTQKGTPCLEELKKEFSHSIIDSSGNLIRKKLGDIVFKNKEKLVILNNITHKYIMKRSDEIISSLQGKNIVLDAPLLFEAGLDKKCDKTISVICPKNERIKRIINRDSISEEQAKNRINSQHEDTYYIQKSDFIIENNGNQEDMLKSLNKVLKELESVYND